MENASKALIIAGAILISILIITLGILVFGQAKGAMDGNAMSSFEIEQFNQRFTQFEGTRVRGATVNSMLSTILANNISADDDSRKIKVSGNAGIAMASDATGLPTKKANTGAIYNVHCNFSGSGSNKGLVNEIVVDNAT